MTYTKTCSNFFLLILIISCLWKTACNGTDPIPNRNIQWGANSCWISVGIQALTACTEFVEAYKKMEFKDHTPEQYLKEIFTQVTDNTMTLHRGRPVSSKPLLQIDQFYTAFAQKGIIQHGSGGGFFVPQFLEYIKTHVDPELAYRFFGIITQSQKQLFVNNTPITGIQIAPIFSSYFRESNILSLARYSLFSINILEAGDTHLFESAKTHKNILLPIQRSKGKIATLSLVAKALDGYSSSSNPSGPHTIVMAKKNNNEDNWFLYDDLNKIVKKIEFQVPYEDNGYAVTYFKYKNINDIYRTDLVYCQVDAPTIQDPATKSLHIVEPKSLFECVKHNQGEKLHDPTLAASLNTADPATSLFALHLACIKANRKIIKQLVTQGANVNAITNLGDTPLHFAAITCSEKTINFLISKGAQVNMLNKLGRSPLYYAIKFVNPRAMNALLKAGADINLQLQEIKNVESAQPLFNYFLNKISTQNVIALAPLVHKIVTSKILTHCDEEKIKNFLTDDRISRHWNYDAAQQIKMALNAIVLKTDIKDTAHPTDDTKQLHAKLKLLQESLEKLKNKLNLLKGKLINLKKAL